MGDSQEQRRSGYWQQWLSPSTLLPAIGFVAAAYAWQVTTDARVKALEKTVEEIRQEYQRRDVLEQRIGTIDIRIRNIEQMLGSVLATRK